MTIDIHTLITALKRSWSAETAYDASDWSPQNPARGQCAVSSLVVQDYLGGELVRFASEFDGRKEKHYAKIEPPPAIGLKMASPHIGPYQPYIFSILFLYLSCILSVFIHIRYT